MNGSDQLLYASTTYAIQKGVKQLRFEYSEKFTKLLEEFTKEHMNEDRKTFKTKWISWKEENQTIYDEEIKKIKDDGYAGDTDSKIFESVRYYYRKKQLRLYKSNQPKNQTTEYLPKQKTQKLKCLSKTIIQSMDKHMKVIVLENTIDVSPASTYRNFCETNIIEITKEVYRLKGITKAQLDPVEIEVKFKKAYKNRFYKFIQSIQ